eukprot:c18970_g1_i1.p1 GENE.c18970_g1_i1~~c18970_g1_i1.p1  ORF type:complete len:403 (+),score=75.63 c18970_g1_i1:94-1302(+)
MASTPRKIIIFFDGTGQDGRNDEKPQTNIWKLYNAIKDEPGIDVSYYPGIGTGQWGYWYEPVTIGLQAMFGYGLYARGTEGYKFLIDAVNTDDVKKNGAEIYIFGFSRGAFAARSLASVIRKCGLGDYEKIRRHYPSPLTNAQLLHKYFTEVGDRYRLSKKDLKPDDPDSIQFRKDTSVKIARQEEVAADDPEPNCKVQFLGVFDTVGAMGMNPEFAGPGKNAIAWFDKFRFGFHDENLSKIIHVARQALAIDEHRKAFEPILWTPHARVNSKQVWFAGDHSDIGGGHPAPIISDTTLLWMAKEAYNGGLQLGGLENLIGNLQQEAKMSPTESTLGKLHGQPAQAPWTWRYFWKVMGFVNRSLGDATHRDIDVDCSVLTRQKLDSFYRPPQLAAFTGTRPKC